MQSILTELAIDSDYLIKERPKTPAPPITKRFFI